MNPALLFAHFDRISDTPDAIPLLRSFVLDLAVRGKLLPQQPEDEPAYELLKRIQVEKARLIKEGKIGKEQPLPLIDDKELPYQSPSGWIWARLGAITKRIHYGYTASANQSLTDVRLLRITDIQNNAVNWLSVPGVEISESEVEQYKLQRGDILIARTGGTIGKTFLVGQLPATAVFASYLIRVQGSSAICDQYLKLFLESPIYWKQLQEGSRGGGQPNVNGKTLGRMIVALPPFAEQQRIVAKVSELMLLCDRLEIAHERREAHKNQLAVAALHELNNGARGETLAEKARFYLNHISQLTVRPEQIAPIRQTVLNLAVRGQLVPQDPDDEPAGDLLKRVLAKRRSPTGVGHRLQPITPGELDGTVGELPSGWQWMRISDLLLGDSQNGYSKKPDDAPHGVPILRISAGTVRRDGVVAEEENKLISGVSEELQEQYQLQAGDLLACRFNGNRRFVGRLSLYVGYLGIKHIYPDKLIRLRLIPGLMLPTLLRYFAESDLVRKDIEGYCATTVGNWGISATNLKEVKIPLPPFQEQHRIVARVEELMVLCSQLETQLTTTQNEKGRLLSSVLYHALNDKSAASSNSDLERTTLAFT
jgi:type I restriction enzyme S subunit